MISLVAAMANDRVIGNRNRLPWHLPADLRRFKAITMGKPLLMGRLTHQSIGRPLPGRRNIVVSRNPAYAARGCAVVASVGAALALAADAPELMVIGGASVYRRLLAQAGRIHLTRVYGEFPGDTWFPELDPADWTLVEREDFAADGSNPYPYSFIRLERFSGAEA